MCFLWTMVSYNNSRLLVSYSCSFVEFLGTDHYVSEVWVGQFPKKGAAKQKRLKKKNRTRGAVPWEKEGASAFCEPGSVFDFKKLLHNLKVVRPLLV